MGGKTTTQSNEPWGAAKPALETTLKDAGKLYEQGIGGRTWTGMTNAPMTMQQTGGLNHMMNTAQGFQPWMNTGANRLDNVSNSIRTDPSMAQGQGFMGGLLARSQDPSMSEQNLSGIAQGKMLGGGDPYFNQALDTASRKAQDAVNLQAGQMGRSGSGANYGNVAREIGDIQTTARSNQYNLERQNQVQANQLIDSLRGQGLDRRIGAANNLFQMGQQGVNNQLAAFDRMGQAYDYSMRPGQTGLDVGQRYQDQAQNVLNDQINQFDATQNAGWNQLARYNAIAQGHGGLGGTQTARSGGGFGDVLGGLLGVLGGMG